MQATGELTNLNWPDWCKLKPTTQSVLLEGASVSYFAATIKATLLLGHAPRMTLCCSALLLHSSGCLTWIWLLRFHM